jgi:hypothetical protein
MKLPTLLIVSILPFAPFSLAELGGLEHPNLQPLIAQANGYLAAGQINDAIKAFTEAIGECLLDTPRYGISTNVQASHPLIIYCTTSELQPNFPSRDTPKHLKILNKQSNTPKVSLRRRT